MSVVEGTVLVVGGSRGIGRAVVEALAAERTKVAFTWRGEESAARALEESLGGEARAFQFDVRDRRRPEALVEEIDRGLGPIDGLVYCAGMRRDGLLALTSDDDWDAVLDTNLGGLFRVCRAVLPGMLRRRRGAIVAVSSLSAVHGVAGQTLYASSKAGMVAMVRALARECGKRNVRANAVAPGYVPTDFVADLPERAVEALRATECLRRGTSVGDVAQAVLFLLSERAASITGQMLMVDAGASV